MATINALKKLSQEMSASTSGSESSDIQVSSHNELSEALAKMRIGSDSSFRATSETESDSARAAAKAAEDSDVKLQRRAIRIMAHETDKASNNVILHVKYLSSPLRLFLKAQLQKMSHEARVSMANTVKISDAVKSDLVSDWSIKDSFGLKVLVKMYRMWQNLFPMLGGHADFMAYMKPLASYADPAASMRKPITFYLYNTVMNPGHIFYTHENSESMEHELHGWIDNFLEQFREDLEEVGFSLDDAKEELIKKTAFELNVYASVIFKKALSFKYSTGQKVVHDPESLIKELYNLFDAVPATKIISEQMMYWLMNDDDFTAAPRAIRGGGFKKGKGKGKGKGKKK